MISVTETAHGTFNVFGTSGDEFSLSGNLTHAELLELRAEVAKALSQDLPEGLHVQSGPRDGELMICDAQDHPWVTLHEGANGDPVEWRNAIGNAVIGVLQAFDERD